MKAGSRIRRWALVAAVALAIGALELMPGAAAGLDSGIVTNQPDAGLVPPARLDGGVASRAERRRWRRMRRLEGGAVTLDYGPSDGGPPRDGGTRVASLDAGPRAPIMPPRIVPPPPPIVPPPPSTPSTSLPVTEQGFNTCHKIPAGKRAVRVTLKPDVELPELVAWISSVTCKSFVLPGHLSAGGKKITFVTQGTMTPREAYAAFLTALDSIGLTVEQGRGYLRIIETAKAKTGAVPVYGFDGQPAQPAPR